MRDLQTRYFETARTVVERYGGTVEKFIGDAVMAVWGAPVAQEDDALTNTPLYRERLLIVTAPNDPLAARQAVSTQEILRQPFVMAGRRSGLHRRALLEKALGRSGLIVTREVADQEALKEAVRGGLGCGLLPQTLVESDVRDGLLAEIPVDGVSLVEEICLVRRSRGHFSSGAMAFCAEILDSREPALVDREVIDRT